MATYVILGRFSHKGVEKVSDLPALLEMAYNKAKNAGGTLQAFHFTLGQYDFVTIWEFPSEEAAMKALLAVSQLGAFRTETLRSMPMEKIREIARGL